jgi:hypothetical protein
MFMSVHQLSVSNFANTCFSGAAISSTIFEIYAALAASAESRVSTLVMTHDIFLYLPINQFL